jgi:hypothetical protein
MLSTRTELTNSVSAPREADQNGLSFLPTPGPGDSEGGDIYAPALESSSSGRSGRNDAAGAD